MFKSLHKHLLTALAVALALPCAAQSAKPAAVPYTWKSVQIVGGGFVDGFIYHPTAKDVLYARTDMGGAYRRSPGNGRWEPMLDWVSYEDLNLMGVESIAVDPQDASKVYLACGTYSTAPDGAILRSSDQGHTFQRTNVPIKFGGNENGRGNGERMAVDPNDGSILYLGTRHSGLWRSTDGAATWSRVASFPEFKPEPEDDAMPDWQRGGRNSLVFVLFDKASGSKGHASQTIYVGVSVMNKPNFYRSTDGGQTWQPVPGAPQQYRPTHAVLASDGNMFLSYGTDPGPMGMKDGGIWRFNLRSGAWSDITPDKPGDNRHFGYAAVAVDPQNPQVLLASSHYRPWTNGTGDDIFRTIDGGKTWKGIFTNGGAFDYALAPYVKDTGIHWLFDVEIDPSNPEHALFTTGYGGWETFDLSAIDHGKPTHWQVMSPGIEETVPLSLYSPVKGAPLVTGIGDYSGFVHWDLDAPAPGGNPRPPFFGNTNEVTGGDLKPELIVRVGHGREQWGSHGQTKDGNIGYSEDGGKTWKETVTAPNPKAELGRIAVSADGATWVWTPEQQRARVTRDKGMSWETVNSLEKEIHPIADRVNPQTFYALDLFGGKLFASHDAAASFTEQPLVLPDGLPQRGGDRGDNRGGQDQLYATPGREGDLWLAAFNGLYHAPDAGKSFVRLPGVSELLAFGFGKAAPGSEYPALYMVGVVNGQRGIFRSTDAAQSWVRINDDQHQWGKILLVTGDPKQFGRVYVGTHGRGAFYGDPAQK
jgi:photosystem II stability/assembly factor-like uncharacterized protein